MQVKLPEVTQRGLVYKSAELKQLGYTIATILEGFPGTVDVNTMLNLLNRMKILNRQLDVNIDEALEEIKL